VADFRTKLAEARAREAAQAAEQQQAAQPEVAQPESVPPPVTTPVVTLPVGGSVAERIAALRAQGLGSRLMNRDSQPEQLNIPVSQSGPGSQHIPDVGGDELVLSAEEMQLDADIKGIGVVGAYNRWAGKKQIPVTYRSETKVSCPKPDHPDRNPSAWMNPEKGTWYCGGCGEGGDLWDIAAYHYGYPVPGYKSNPDQFRTLRERIALELGYQKYTTSTGTVLSRTPPVLEPDPPLPEDEPTVESNTVEANTVEGVTTDESAVPDNVVQLFDVEDEEYAAAVGQKVASIDWRALVPGNTFLRAWMEETTKDTCPEEFHFWTGLMALGFAVGRNRVLQDNPTVVPNIFVCLTGPSGTGKSRAKAHLKRVIAEALPFDPSDQLPIGTKIGGTPGSGEVLVDILGHKIDDPTDPTNTKKKDWPIRVLFEFDEMATLISRGQRAGSTLKPYLMEAYDAPYSMNTGSRGHGNSFALQPYAQTLTTTQNKSIREVVNNKDDQAGFINRWVFVTGPRKPQRAINTYVTDYTIPAKHLRIINARTIAPREVGFTDEALEKFEEFYKEVFAMKDKAEETTAIFNRIDLLLKKLTLLFAINDNSDTVQLAHVERMKAIYPYLIEVYGVVKMEMSTPESDLLEQRIVGAVVRYYDRHKKAMTMSYIKKLIKDVDSEALDKAIKHMIRFELLILEEHTPGQRGRPSSGRLLPGRVG
jgi:hypothetical protein